MITPEQMNEREKLIEQYKQKHKAEPRYGAGRSYHAQVEQWVKRFDLEPVLDWGCGKGGLVRHLQSVGIEAHGWDPAVPEWQQKPQGPFKGLVCLDVFEHLHPDHLVAELRAMEAATEAGGMWFLNIATTEAFHRLPDGRNCHEIVQPPEWWLQQIGEIVEGASLSTIFETPCNVLVEVRL